MCTTTLTLTAHASLAAAATVLGGPISDHGYLDDAIAPYDANGDDAIKL